jgi:hypothetical protein
MPRTMAETTTNVEFFIFPPPSFPTGLENYAEFSAGRGPFFFQGKFQANARQKPYACLASCGGTNVTPIRTSVYSTLYISSRDNSRASLLRCGEEFLYAYIAASRRRPRKAKRRIRRLLSGSNDIRPSAHRQIVEETNIGPYGIR